MNLTKNSRPSWRQDISSIVFLPFLLASALSAEPALSIPISQIGSEVAVQRHLVDSEEFRLAIDQLLSYRKLLFDANWTDQESGGRPMSKGTGRPLADSLQPLMGTRAFNRISGRDANS